ncbi:MAG: hypothetical protein K2M95_01320, partial [Clostridiales bacterium]|nr:hypothetical protein [Clostridiales bacterium]
MASVTLLSGCGYYRYAVIPDYDTFLATFSKWDDAAKPHDKLLPIEGFVPLFGRYFDYGQGFVGNVTLAVKDDVTYFLRADGAHRETNFDLFESVV